MTCRLAILRSTGSVGRPTLEVVEHHPDRLAVTAVSAGRTARAPRQPRGLRRPRRAMEVDSVAPEVKINSSGWQDSSDATCPRARSTAAAAPPPHT